MEFTDPWPDEEEQETPTEPETPAEVEDTEEVIDIIDIPVPDEIRQDSQAKKLLDKAAEAPDDGDEEPIDLTLF